MVCLSDVYLCVCIDVCMYVICMYVCRYVLQNVFVNVPTLNILRSFKMSSFKNIFFLGCAKIPFYHSQT